MRSVLSVLLVALASLSLAQTPGGAIRGIVDALNKKDLDAAMRLIKGAEIDPQMRKSILGAPWPTFTLKDVSEKVTGKSATVSYQIALSGVAGMPAPHRESATLARIGSGWIIIPPDKYPAGNDIIPSFAYMVSHSSATKTHMATADKVATCLSNIKQICLGCVMYSSDHDDKLDFKAVDLAPSLQPYVRNKTIFTCPLDPAGTISYSLNANLVGVLLSKISRPAQTVMVYEGKNGKLNFRHGGKAAVGFADGHAALIDQAKSKGLVWKK